MQKNVSGQKIVLLALDVSTNAPKTGDAANLTAYVSKDWGAVTVLTDTSATELDATNAPGLYSFDLAQAETNADELIFSGKSATANIKIVPRIIQTVPGSFSTLTIANSCVDADVERLLGTAWLTPGTAGTPDVNMKLISGDATAADNAEAFFDGTGYAGTGNVIPTVTTLTGHTPQTGDAYAIVNSGVHGNAALKTLIDAVDNFVDTEIASIISTLGAPAGASISADILTIPKVLARGTAQSGTASTIVLAASSAFATSELDGNVVKILSGTGAGQSRVITSNAGASDTCNIAPNWTTNPSSDSVYEIIQGSVNVSHWLNTAVTVNGAGTPKVDVVAWLGTTVATPTVNGVPEVDVTHWVGATTVPSNVTTVFNTDFATNYDTTNDKWQVLARDHAAAALATASALDAVDNFVDTEIASIISTLASLFTTQLTESYAADGAAPTVAQSLMLIQQALTEGAISGTTWTGKKLDGSTTAFTITLDSATTPTSKTRAT